ncbi:MLH1-like protein 1 [Histomonas meleagridis]|uniref:MLH1-like protein 1 n=1 Tax=Histomonas meleagridis TaxID=135588 RepID=UPI003559D9D5|nr:MLH1-like protein 1 [Histomonas meleagridis]KAH0799164.1 MLH1-like protein 1 [Histomonas meleagridis]
MTSPKPIIQLPQSVINCISAGEVIHQPCNVVKELLENSLDAGANRISISLESGGFTLIKISDDGCGISYDNLPLACTRHATSKLKQFSDLSKLCTFGFRGEALFSMSCVSHLQIHSKTVDEDVSYFAKYENGEIIGDPIPEAGTVGTCIEVQNLFYNKPEKLRAIPDSYAQNRSVLQIATQYAIAFPQRSIVVKIDNKEKLHTIGNTTSENVISLIYGVNSTSSIIQAQIDLGFGAHATVFLGTIGSAKSLKGSTIFINERLVRCNKVRRSVESVFSEFLMKGEKPFFVLMLKIPPQNIDVNVHPTKKDVTFANSEQITANLCEAIRNHLNGNSSSRKFTSASQPQQIQRKTAVSKSTSSSQNSLSISQIFQSNESQQIVQDEPPTPDDYDVEQEDDELIENYHISKITKTFIPNEEFNIDPTKLQPVEEEEVRPKRRFGLNTRQSLTSTSSSSSSTPIKSPQPSQRPTAVNSKRKLFEELKHEPISTKYVRCDPTERTLEQVIASSQASQYKSKARRNLNIGIVQDLLSKIHREYSEDLLIIFQRHVFVGFIDLSDVLLQSDDILYICNLFSITQNFFYQLFVRHFGNYGRITFDSPLNISALLQLTCPNSEDIENIIHTLEENNEMLDDYFCIKVELGTLTSMPMILPGYTPSFTSLPLFLFRIGTEVQWEFEVDCITSLINELSMMYAIQKEDISDTDISQRLMTEIRDIVLPEMRTNAFEPNAKLLRNKKVERVRSVSEMYKIFERT